MSCPFCHPSQILLTAPQALALPDGYPITPGHALIVPKRHIASWFEASTSEQEDMLDLLNETKKLLDQQYQPDGYNIGINDGQAAGQTVGHLHLHLIPRYQGDCEDPRGGVRWIVPHKAKYWD